jgi:hypothetical protein
MSKKKDAKAAAPPADFDPELENDFRSNLEASHRLVGLTGGVPAPLTAAIAAAAAGTPDAPAAPGAGVAELLVNAPLGPPSVRALAAAFLAAGGALKPKP